MVAIFNGNTFNRNTFDCGTVGVAGWFPEWDLPAHLVKQRKRHSIDHLNMMLSQQQAFGPKQYQQALEDYERELANEWYEAHLEAVQRRRKKRLGRN